MVNSTAHPLPSSRPRVHSRDPAFQQKPPLFQTFIIYNEEENHVILYSAQLEVTLFIKETEKELGSDLGERAAELSGHVTRESGSWLPEAYGKGFRGWARAQVWKKAVSNSRVLSCV